MGITQYIKAASFLFKSKPYALEKPIVIQFPVIDICNSRCQMCRIWENKKSDDVEVDKLRSGLRNPLFSEVISVGLNGGEPTLRKDLPVIASILYKELPKIKSISLITNAYKYQEVISRITEVGEVVRKNNGYFDVMISLDGYGEVHDRVRGKPGNFDNALKVIDFLCGYPLVDNVRIGCTIIKENVYGLSDLFEFCQSRGLYIKYRLGVPHQRLYTQNLLDPYSLSVEEKYHIVEFLEGLIRHYETNGIQKFFYRSLIDQIIYRHSRKAGCDWQHRGVTITSKGELLYCAVQSKILCNIASDDSEKAYFGNQLHLDEIIEKKCDSCKHDYVGIPPKREYARQIISRLIEKARLNSVVRFVFSSIVKSVLNKFRVKRRINYLRNFVLDTTIERDKGKSDFKRVLICGWYGTETLGDKAILGGIIESIRRSLENIEIILVSLHPYVSEMTQKQMDELRGVKIVNVPQGIELAGTADLVLIGGGPLMALNELAELELMFNAAHKSGAATLVAGCGVGPFGDKWQNDSLSRILSMASLRIYRDEKSRSLASSLGVDTSQDIVAEDPAFTWLCRQRESMEAIEPPKDCKVLLLGLRDFPYAQYARHLSKRECVKAKKHYECVIISALVQLINRHPDLVIKPLPMCTNHFGDDDRWFYRRLFRGIEQLQGKLDFSLLNAELSPKKYCEAFRGAHAALTMRFHSVVFALGLNVPTVAIDYTLGKGKVQALAERFGLAYQSLDKITASFIVNEIERLFEEPVTQSKGFVPTFGDIMQIHLPKLLNVGKVRV